MKKFSFPRNRFIRKKREFDLLKRFGRRIDGDVLSVVFARWDNPTRFALIVPGRVGTAVRRNRMRRVIREHLRTARNWKEGYAILVIVSRYAEARQIREELDSLFAKIFTE